LIKINLAQLQLENRSDGQLVRARDNLIDALRYEPEMASAWRFLATAEGRLGNAGKASLALAEEASLRRNKARALSHSKRAMETLPEGSPGWFRAQDIENSFKEKE
jgi:predicted Zn-dependent protease